MNKNRWNIIVQFDTLEWYNGNNLNGRPFFSYVKNFNKKEKKI